MRFLAVTCIVLGCGAINFAGQPANALLKLRSVDVVRCERVTTENVALMSSYVRTPGNRSGNPEEVVAGAPGLLIEGIVLRQRTLSFPLFEERDDRRAAKDSGWSDGDSAPQLFFFPKEPESSCKFMVGHLIHVIESQKAECDTFPPEGLCAFDRPIHLVESTVWEQYGESVAHCGGSSPTNSP